MALIDLFRGGTEELGPLVRIPCPQCNEDRWFNLRRYDTSPHLFGFPIGAQSSHSIHCSTCDHPLHLSEHDAEKALGFLPTAKRRVEGGMTEEAFRALLEIVKFDFMDLVAKANTTWTCACGEESPLTFSTCWCCGKQRDEIPRADDSREVDTPVLDRALNQSDDPLGPLNL